MRSSAVFTWCFLPLLILALALLASCQKPSPPPSPANAQAGPAAVPAAPPSEIEQAVRSYIENVRKVDTGRMAVTLKDVKVEGDKATCRVEYTLKEGGMPPMAYAYELARESGTWKVLSSQPVGAAHGGQAMPPTEGSMPPGHPPVGSGSPPAPGLAPAHQPSTGAGH